MAGPQSYKPRFSNDDKNLIAEQPGRVVLFMGVLLALTLGLIVRGVLAPNKVRAHIVAAASRIHKDLDVHFETASVSLSRGLLPRFAVIITNVKMESSNACWMTPSLMADEIRLPLSLWALVRGENPVTEVGAGQVRVELRSEYKNCDSKSTSTTATPAEEPAVTQFVTLKNKKSQSPESAPRPQVEAIGIDTLTIVAPTLSAPLELSAFEVRLKSNSPRVIEMTAKTHLIRDEQFGDYLSHAAISVEYTEFPKTQVLGRILGNWREGSYQMTGNYFLAEDDLSCELDLKHVPISQVGQVLKKFKWAKNDFNTRQVWVSVHAQMNGQASQLKKAHLQVKDLRLEGDLGDIRVPQVQVLSFEPLSYSPFFVDIEKLKIEKLLTLIHRPHPSPALGQLGAFTGRAEVTSVDELRLVGVHRGMEFIFSNKGQRELQTLNEISTDLRYGKNRWNLSAANAVVDQGVLDGSLQVSADRDLRNLEIDGKIAQLKLSPNIIRLMTAGGRIGALSGELHMKVREGQPNTLKGAIATEEVAVEGVELSRSRWQIDTVKNEVVLNGQLQRMAVSAGSPSFQVLKNIIEPDWMNDGKLEVKTISTQLQFQTLKTLAWKNLSAQLDKGVRITSEGQWDLQGNLSGQIQATSSKASQRWILGGRRDEPLFAMAETARKRKQ
jgi:hypothetical protein